MREHGIALLEGLLLKRDILVELSTLIPCLIGGVWARTALLRSPSRLNAETPTDAIVPTTLIALLHTWRHDIAEPNMVLDALLLGTAMLGLREALLHEVDDHGVCLRVALRARLRQRVTHGVDDVESLDHCHDHHHCGCHDATRPVAHRAQQAEPRMLQVAVFAIARRRCDGARAERHLPAAHHACHFARMREEGPLVLCVSRPVIIHGA